MTAPNKGNQGKGEERRGGEEGNEGMNEERRRELLYIGGRGPWGAAPRAGRRPNQPPPQTLGFGAHGPGSPTRSMWLFSPMAHIGPLGVLAQIN